MSLIMGFNSMNTKNTEEFFTERKQRELRVIQKISTTENTDGHGLLI